MNIAPPDPPRPDKQAASTHPIDAGQAAFFPNWEVVGCALETCNIAMWCWNIASNKITWSSNFETLHGLCRGSFDGTLSSFQQSICSDDQYGVLAQMQAAQQARTTYRLCYRLRPRPGSDERWIEASGAVLGQDGAPAAMIGIFRDVTEQVSADHKLRARASQHQAVARLAERAVVESDLQKLLDEAVTTTADILAAELVEILELIASDAHLLLRAGAGWNPGLVGAAHVSTEAGTQAGFTLSSTAPVIVDELNAEARFSAPSHLQDHGVVSGLSVPITDSDGRTYGIVGAHSRCGRRFDDYDASLLIAIATIIAGAIRRHQLDHRHELMIRELRHRSGNLFSQLLALLSQTASSSRNIAELVAKYQARVLALANAHRLITEGGWKSASLSELLRTLLAPYLDRVSFSGPNVFLEPDPAFALSTVVHELTTNASKYGSLSKPAGRLDVTWSAPHTEQGFTLVFNWQERNGPAPKRARRAGFGFKLIDMVIRRQLNGDVHRTFHADGLHARLVVPLTHERWPGPAPTGLAAANREAAKLSTPLT